MPRTASPALLAHFASPAQTVAYLLKVGPLPDSSYLTMASTGRDVVYDDGDGERTYYARTGVQLANLASTSDLDTDNSEAQTLVNVPVYPGQGLTEAMVDSGELDDVPYVVYAVNYEDLSMGDMVLHSGPVGKVRLQVSGLVTLELRAWADLLRQNSVVERWSLTCRVKKFGSQPGEERFPCMYDASVELGPELTVTAVGSEVVRHFTVSGLAEAADYYAPGKWLWTAGANVGMTREIQTHDGSGNFTLLFIARKPIQVGDKGRPMRECSREWAGHNSCETYNNRPWFRGEPFIPVADAIGLTVPGAAAGGFE